VERHRLGASSAWWCWLLAGSLLAAEGDAKKLLPLPSPDAQADARLRVKDELQDQYAAAKTPDRKAALVEKLLQLALAPETAPDAQFALLSEARELATGSGQVELVLRVIDELAQRFEVDGIKLRMAALKELEPGAKTPEARTALSNGLVELSYDAAAAERFDIAQDAAGLALAAATKAKDRLLAAELSDRRRELQQAAKEYNAAQNAEQVLAGNPDERNACRTLGNYLCLVKQDWERGLPLLAKGAGGKLQALAEREAIPPADVAEQMDFADDWLAFSKSGTSKVNAKFAGRAVHWFKLAQQSAQGTARLRCEKGLKEALEVRDADSPVGTVLGKLKSALQSGKLVRNPMVGCITSNEEQPTVFEAIPKEGALLIGFNLTIGPWNGYTVVRSVQPVFATASETVVGEMFGEPAGPIVEIRPRPGYVVTGLNVKAGTRIDVLAVQYARLKKTGIDPKTSYWTRFYGGVNGGESKTAQSNGKPIVGLYGQHGGDIFKIGFVTPP
jgi:hypothetical protein